MTAAAILGCEGLRLTAQEKAFFRDVSPWGFILFARNIDTPDQVRALCAELREAAGRNAPILIDQEGGRVARLKAPHWREWPRMDDLLARTLPEANVNVALRVRFRLIAAELHALGIDVNCVPMVDVPAPGADPIVTTRVMGADPAQIARRGRQAAEALMDGGVLPVVKHVPGHGRATADSHLDLPVVDADLATLRATDFLPFRELADLPMMMTAHIVYPALDPENCATHSPRCIDAIRGDIGFHGLLMTDDLGMHALKGSFRERAEASFAAGCDVALHCSGKMAEMRDLAEGLRALDGPAAARAAAAEAARTPPHPVDLEELDRRHLYLVGEAEYEGGKA
ncbi:glycoside hydrolase family 3 N-terminal domain-containing protein [Rhodovulum sp. DZ06]|uniref:glycoside hydrolase family 3 N-terminal domain-containing protein n=1 Tax=Rhodovulum sp. DZ06 TaxID=3425126 RepID=UPI003D34E450